MSDVPTEDSYELRTTSTVRRSLIETLPGPLQRQPTKGSIRSRSSVVRASAGASGPGP